RGVPEHAAALGEEQAARGTKPRRKSHAKSSVPPGGRSGAGVGIHRRLARDERQQRGDRPRGRGADGAGRAGRRRDRRAARFSRAARADRQGSIPRGDPVAAGARATQDRSGANGLIRPRLAIVVAVVLALAPRAVAAQDPGAGPNAHHEAARIIAAELAMQDAPSRLVALAAEKPAAVADSVRHELAIAAAQYAFR